MLIHMTNISAKHAAKYTDTVSSEIGAKGRTDVSRLVTPQPERCIWPRYDIDLSPMNLKTFSAIHTYKMNICAKFQLKFFQ